MTVIFTSRFQNPELATDDYTVVGIVRGIPRYRLNYKLAGNIIDIAPPRELFSIYDREKFTPPYMAHLDRLGVGKVKAQLQKYLDMGKDVVLCCYEDVREPNEWCHRLVFASWWMLRTGQVIPELKDDSPIKVKVRKLIVSNRPLMQEKVDPASTATKAEPLKIWTVCSLWFEDGWHSGNMYYQIDPKTSKKVRIADALARDLVLQGKAELVQDEDSKARIKFVLFDEPASKAYWLARDGTEREIDFESALNLVMDSKARIHDIQIGQKPYKTE